MIQDDTQIAWRLERVTLSIESFFASQIDRLQSMFDKCQAQIEEGRLVQRIMADFESKIQDWEQQRQAELARLNQASEKLIAGWKSLENEQRKWLAARESTQLSAVNGGQDPTLTTSRNSQMELCAQPTAATAGPPELNMSQLQRLRHDIEQHSRQQQ